MAVLAICDPTIPVNSGLREAVDFVLPEGSVVNPRHPATVNLYFPTAHLVYNTVLSALGQLNPARAVAPSGLGLGGGRPSATASRAAASRRCCTSCSTPRSAAPARNDGAAVGHGR